MIAAIGDALYTAAYDYDDINDADRVLPRAVPPAVGVVIVTYVLVALGAASLVGAMT